MMRLLDALRLDKLPRLAFVGAGGKTTALFQLARQLFETPLPTMRSKTILLTATTHLAIDQLGLADRHFEITKLSDLAPIEKTLPTGLLLFTGPQVEVERVAGLSGLLLDRLYQMAEEHQLPLLIEADGSRRRPLKAPADHEPVIPDWVTQVVVVAGLSALGQPLTGEWVHRPERYAQLSGLAPGEIIDACSIARLLLAPQGGLKSIPPFAQRLVLLNQAETVQSQSASLRIATSLLPDYRAVIVSALDPPTQAGTLNNAHSGVIAIHQRIAGVVLAAGAANRFGSLKQLLTWRGMPFIRHVAQRALTVGLSPLVVVTGYAASQVQAAVDDLGVEIVHNPDWHLGQSTSVLTGLRSLPDTIGSVVFLLADQPQVSVTLLRSLIELHARTLSALVAPLIDGQRANPVLFDRCTFDQFNSLTGDRGGRALFSRFPVTWLPWIDPDAAFDVDTPADYQRLLRL